MFQKKSAPENVKASETVRKQLEILMKYERMDQPDITVMDDSSRPQIYRSKL